ncbi:UDP-N-acetylmuramoyl-L-alanyl-D-glutamate--2,6-diaminopimelate ligase [Suttonella ornithocola]|uniref:UDP-N-acetylmuramoyl-L-alanyl-D-glutamate--2,6-diaminopimelate ligase n=1 Tax=Suttonella ornithocola TaxID=279832 RepID=A0A380MXB4_9GAMM|nr:UDP-N-acetylmuramoyl-L-alanyl-D-glutamate--2,6-diaminopimelate ligase [Suttonella ornithocola]SUO97240.1 UDP-N-acetylmuramoyl-L-alanyl-D-glutamate--2,6-diaminopimelate ligase [Suttonella ornithocola]
MLSLKDWLATIGMTVNSQQSVKAIAVDSRECDKDTWWLAEKGITHHALDFYQSDMAFAGILFEPPYENPPKGAIAVLDLSSKISQLADVFYHHPSQKLRIIGVTGTDGKSSLVHFLAQGLDAAMLGTIGYGRLSHLQSASHTTPNALHVQSLLSDFVSNGAKVAAMEVSSHALMQNRVAAVTFDTAVFTNLSRDHLDYHQTMEAYFQAKAKLFAYPLRHAIINLDDKYGQRLVDEKYIHSSATIWGLTSQLKKRPSNIHRFLSAKNIQLLNDGIAFTLEADHESVKVQTPLLARFNIDNLLNVAACLLSGGLSLMQTAEVLSKLKGVPGRVEKIALGNKKNAIVDYAHTAGAIESVLTGIRPHVAGKLWLIFGCGGDRDRGKRPLMAASAEKFADEIVLTDDNPRTENPSEIIKDMISGLEHPENVHVVQPRDAAIFYVLERMKAGDTVLIAGKGHEDYQIIGNQKTHFSDQETVHKWLNQ